MIKFDGYFGLWINGELTQIFSFTEQNQEQTPEELEESRSLRVTRFSPFVISLPLSMTHLFMLPIYLDAKLLFVSPEE